MKMYIHSSYGVHECVPLQMQDITDVQAENNQFTVTADNKDTESASESCCDLSPETPF